MWSQKEYKSREVFGQTRGIPLNYVEREDVDRLFKDSLTSNQHIVIHGSSKQGKTSLRKHNLREDQFILIHCSNQWDIGKLNAQILKQAGFELHESRETTFEGKAKMKASFSFLKLFEAGGEGELGGSESNAYKSLELDVYDSNDIIKSLEEIGFDKLIILEDFHYLDEITQENFAFQLKAFHEISSYTFIIVGVWLEENKLTLLNGDLAGRMFSINADKWTHDQMKHVITKGEDLLNIHFSHQLKTKIIQHSLGSVFLLQEICKGICDEAGIYETQKRKINLIKEYNVFNITKKLILQRSGRYDSFLMIVAGGRDDEYKNSYKNILNSLLSVSTEDRIKGISFDFLYSDIVESVDNNLNESDLYNILKRLSLLQREKKIKPRIIDYDFTNSKLNIVDKGFTAWLVFQDTSILMNRLK